MKTIQLITIFFVSVYRYLKQKKSITQADKSTELFFFIYKTLLEKSKDKSITWLREMIAASIIKSPEQKRVIMHTTTYNNVTCRWYYPNQQQNIGESNSAIIVYFHGGGYVVGDLNQYANLNAALALRCNLPVLYVDYRLGPEYPFPAAQQDCIDVIQALGQDFPNNPIIVAGDSAGGGLCLNCLLNWPQNMAPALAGIMLSPYVDPNEPPECSLSKEATDILDNDLRKKWGKLATPKNIDLATKHLTKFVDIDLSTLPKIYIQAADNELLLGQIKRFISQAEQQNVDIEYDIFPGLFHDFQLLHPLSKPATDAVNLLAEKIKDYTR